MQFFEIICLKRYPACSSLQRFVDRNEYRIIMDHSLLRILFHYTHAKLYAVID